LAAPALALFLVLWVRSSTWSTPVSDGPNIVFILSDDQSVGSLPRFPSAMPYLQSRILDPDDHWVSFTNGFVSNPLCCPSRATIFTGQYSSVNGVLKNAYGHEIEEDSTFATWLHDVGYVTGFFGKYINQYPFDREPYVPPGWDLWSAKERGGVQTVYYNYTLIGNGGIPTYYGRDPEDYMPDVLAEQAADFIRNAPGGRPFFVEYAPTTPHAPWVPAPRHEGTFEDLRIEARPNVNEGNVEDKPAWIRAQEPLSEKRLKDLKEEERREYDTLLGMDDGVRTIFKALEERGVLDDTVVIYLSDNGYSYGSHRWIAKRCAYEECNATPFFVRYPGIAARDDATPVSNVDLAATFADLAGVTPTIRQNGESLVPLVERGQPLDRPGVLLEWPGDSTVTGYWGLRTESFLYVELETGERELYDLTGIKGDADQFQLHNVAGTKPYDGIQGELAASLAAMKQEAGIT
jgi:arylsulfatase A-like enzyme